MRKWGYIVFLTLLLAGGAVLCALRWQAWFGMPEEPVWTGVTQDYTFPVFATDTTPEKTTILVLGDIHNRLTQADYDTLAARVPEAEFCPSVQRTCRCTRRELLCRSPFYPFYYD